MKSEKESFRITAGRLDRRKHIYELIVDCTSCPYTRTYVRAGKRTTRTRHVQTVTIKGMHDLAQDKL